MGMLSLTIQMPVDTLAERIRRYRSLIAEAKPITKSSITS